MTDDQPPISPEDAKRIREIEERQAFNEHTTDQLNAELLRLVQAVDKLASRLERLEGRLRTLDALTSGEPDAADPLERPPHSAGPRD
ncbi:MAG: SlyX family protein [Phycisphaerales bacterium]|nr:SlyX family protein [Phycisphaerales bacterium]